MRRHLARADSFLNFCRTVSGYAFRKSGKVTMLEVGSRYGVTVNFRKSFHPLYTFVCVRQWYASRSRFYPCCIDP